MGHNKGVQRTENARIASVFRILGVYFGMLVRVCYVDLAPEQYRATAERNSLHVHCIHTETKAWDFRTEASAI